MATRAELRAQIGRRLHHERKRLGYSMVAFAEALALDRDAVRRMERGEAGIGCDVLLLAHERLDLDPLFVMSGRVEEAAP
jgi:transcriptional regulator with XRE-family HTH domain